MNIEHPKLPEDFQPQPLPTTPILQIIRENELRMLCIFSRESLKLMNGNRGKMVAQAGHAFLHAWWDAYDKQGWDRSKGGLDLPPSIKYKNSNAAVKICLVCDTTDELIKIYDLYKDSYGCTLVTDAARTVFERPTITCVGIGPLSIVNYGPEISALKPLI